MTQASDSPLGKLLHLDPAKATAWGRFFEKYVGFAFAFSIMLGSLLWFGFAMLRNFEAVVKSQTEHLEGMAVLMNERNTTQREQFMLLDKITDGMAEDNRTMRELQNNQGKMIAILDNISKRVEFAPKAHEQ